MTEDGDLFRASSIQSPLRRILTGLRTWLASILVALWHADARLPNVKQASQADKIDYRSVWKFVHPGKLSFKKSRRLANAAILM